MKSERLLAVLTVLAAAPGADASQGFCATVCNASASPTDYSSYFFIIVLTIILIRVIDKFMGSGVAPSGIAVLSLTTVRHRSQSCDSMLTSWQQYLAHSA